MFRVLVDRSIAVARPRLHRHVQLASSIRFKTTSGSSSGRKKGEEDDGDDVTGWIPPNHPLAGDLGQSFLYEKKKSAAAIKDEELSYSDQEEPRIETDQERMERLVKEIEAHETDEPAGEDEFDEDGFLVEDDSDDDDSDYESDADKEDSNDDSMGHKGITLEEIASPHDTRGDDYLGKFVGTKEEWNSYMELVKELESFSDDESDDDDDDDEIEYTDEELAAIIKQLEQEIEDEDNGKKPTPKRALGEQQYKDAEFVEKTSAMAPKDDNNDGDTTPPVDDDDNLTVDWTATRRSKLEGVEFMTPDQAKESRLQADLPIVRHTLLTAEEIITCLETCGGQDVTLLPIQSGYLHETDGMILVTGSHPAQIRLLAETLCRNLKARGLADLGVIGAKLGPEASDKNDEWQVVDCHNYVVHVFDEPTRKALKFETLWGPKSSDNLRSVNADNEEAVDSYVAANPVPKGYNSGDKEDWSQSMARLKKTKWAPPYQQGEEKRNRKKKRGRRRT